MCNGFISQSIFTSDRLQTKTSLQVNKVSAVKNKDVEEVGTS